MFIKLSGNNYINTERITSMAPRLGNEGDSKKWVVHFDADNHLVLTDAQFNQMLACMPAPADGTATKATEWPTYQAPTPPEGGWPVYDGPEIVGL